MNRFENDYMVHFSNGTKQLIYAETPTEAADIAKELCPDDAVVSFITNAVGDIPFSYDWDEKLKKWQGTLF